mgnify:FL=1
MGCLVMGKVARLEVEVLAAARTPVGRRGGALSGIRVDDLAAMVIEELIGRAGVSPGEADEVVAGTVNASGEAMGNLARNAARLAGLPVTVPGFTVNRYCASGLTAVAAGAQMIAAGAADIVIVIGAESMSRSTWPVPKPDRPFAAGQLVARDAMFSGGGGPQHPALEAGGDLIEMPHTAQNLAGRLSISREEMDGWAARSHRLAATAEDEGRFDRELLPVLAEGTEVRRDQTIRRDTSPEKLAGLPAYDPEAPDITAGNSSPVNDGASGLLLASPEAGSGGGHRPLARLTGVASAGVDPAMMGLGAVAAARRLPVEPTAADLVEINEAFASVALATISELELDPAAVNVNGGAIALGHALGNSGTRLLTTLIHELGRRGGGQGLATLCVGGGQGVAASLEVEPRSEAA